MTAEDFTATELTVMGTALMALDITNAPEGVPEARDTAVDKVIAALQAKNVGPDDLIADNT